MKEEKQRGLKFTEILNEITGEYKSKLTEHENSSSEKIRSLVDSFKEKIHIKCSNQFQNFVKLKKKKNQNKEKKQNVKKQF